jgi:hypothetical protein
MKYIISLLFIYFVNITVAFGQEEECEALGERIDFVTASDGGNTNSYVVPVSVKVIRNSNGFTTLNENELLQQIEEFNNKSQYVTLQVTETLYIDSDEYYFLTWSEHFDIRRETNPNTGTTYHNNQALNMYIANTVRNSVGSTLCGFAYYPNFSSFNYALFIANDCSGTSTTPHELGHSFGNYHTHGFSNDFNSTAELVDRSNCLFTGDRLCDTQADPRLSTSTVNTDCEYTGTWVDGNGDLMIPDPLNYMSYSRRSCRSEFTEQQQLEHQSSAEFLCQTMDCQTLGIKDIAYKEFKIYPNPFTDKINLKSMQKYQIYNYLGQKVLEGEGQEVLTTNLEPGAYLLKIGTKTYKVIK